MRIKVLASSLILLGAVLGYYGVYLLAHGQDNRGHSLVISGVMLEVILLIVSIISHKISKGEENGRNIGRNE